MTWEKLTNPSGYGPEEYFILSLIVLVVLVILKHLIFHTFYYWWYRQGRLHIPMRINNLITGKTLSQRLYEHAKREPAEKDRICGILESIELYCSQKEFALTLGKEKGIVLMKSVKERNPDTVLVCGSLCGYSVLRILQASPQSHVYVIEPDKEKCTYTKHLVELVNKSDQVTVISAFPCDVISKLGKDYGVKKLDFVFLTSTSLCEPTHHIVLQTLERSNLFHTSKPGVESPSTVILADKVIHFGESEFLKHVRHSDDYRTEYHQMPLEYSPYDIIDGMEKAVYIGSK